MEKDRVTLEPAAEDYGRRCKSIGLERKTVADLQDAMSHPEFKTSHHTLLDRLAVEYRLSKPLIERPPFATIQIGTFKNLNNLRSALKNAKCNISSYADDLFGRVTLATEPMILDLCRASNAELGLTQGGTVAQTFEAIAKIGGEKLPAEAGPQYRLQNLDQKLGEWELIYMDPIIDRVGCPDVFSVEHGKGGLWLYGYNASPDYFYHAEFVWVFSRKRSVGS
ncbi:MAG: hypothetical protein M1429_00665 [Patescibacteria group bacterium]|nr:hypothetical protein [Patescibacteria group bacterium]